MKKIVISLNGKFPFEDAKGRTEKLHSMVVGVILDPTKELLTSVIDMMEAVYPKNKLSIRTIE